MNLYYTTAWVDAMFGEPPPTDVVALDLDDGERQRALIRILGQIRSPERVLSRWLCTIALKRIAAQIQQKASQCQ